MGVKELFQIIVFCLFKSFVQLEFMKFQHISVTCFSIVLYSYCAHNGNAVLTAV